MEPKFIQVGDVVLDLHKVSSVKFNEDSAVVFMAGGGYNHDFHGEDAEALRRFFAPQPAAQEQPSGKTASRFQRARA